MTDIPALTRRNAARWSTAKLTRGPEFSAVALRLVMPIPKSRYQTVEAKTGVPWYVIAVIHQRESSQKWSASLAQGDPWDRVSVRVPAGRGPFASWEDAAVDALVNCSPYAARNKDWSVGGMLTMLEQYNGLGYANKGVPSPYVWSGTDQYERGKYVADHAYDANVVDKQLGCAGLLLAMKMLDPSIVLGIVGPTTIRTRSTAAGSVVVAGGAVAAVMTWHEWIAAHQWETAGIAAGIAAAIGGTIYMVNRWRKTKQETP